MASVVSMKRVVVACVTTEVVKVTEPAIRFDADLVHLLNYVRKADSGDGARIAREKLYESIYQENVRILKSADIEVEEHRNTSVFNFDDVFHSVYEILTIEKQRGSAIYVNISSGPPEYSAAAAIASMMIDGVTLFTVGAKASGHTIPFDRQKEMLTRDGKLVGTVFDIHDPIEINKFPLPTPDLKLLRALKIFESVPESKRSNVNVVRELIRNSEWKFSSPDCPSKNTSTEFENEGGILIDMTNREQYAKLQNKEAVQYQRAYIDRWKENGWIEKSESNGKRYRLTETGKRYVKVFL